jgi:hypothetical protein
MENSDWGELGLKHYLHAKIHGGSRRKRAKAKAQRRKRQPYLVRYRMGTESN